MTHAQTLKLIKLLGVRYDPQKDLVHMSCEMFETQAQNKRYLGDLVNTLISEAKNGEDMFEDIPVDFRHVKWKRKLEFPEEWKLTPERRQKLERQREERMLAEEEKMEMEGLDGGLVDGVKLIEEANKEMQVVVPKREFLESRVAVAAKKGKGKGRDQPTLTGIMGKVSKNRAR